MVSFRVTDSEEPVRRRQAGWTSPSTALLWGFGEWREASDTPGEHGQLQRVRHGIAQKSELWLCPRTGRFLPSTWVLFGELTIYCGGLGRTL